MVDAAQQSISIPHMAPCGRPYNTDQTTAQNGDETEAQTVADQAR